MGRGVATWSIFAFALPPLLLYLLVRGLPAVEGSFWLVLGINAILDLIGFTLFVRALEEGELGLTYPLLALTPVLVLPVEWILTGEHASLQGASGIALVAAGVYLLASPGEDRGLLAPFRALLREPGARRMLAVAAVWAVSGTIDRVAVLRSSPAFYGAALTTCLAVAFLPAAVRGARRGGGPAPGAEETGGGPAPGAPGREAPAGDVGPASPSLTRTLRAHPGGLALQGLLFAAMFVTQTEALRLTLAAYVITLKRSGTLLTVLAGAIFFRERETGRRLVATAILVAGVLLVSRG